MTRHWNWFNADALGLLRGKYSSVLGALRVGERAIRNCLREQLGMLKADAHDILGDPYPTLIGEIGVPFDMDGKRSYGLDGSSKYVGDYTQQTRALDCSLNGADGSNMINWTLWTYCPDNSHLWGDGWNLEDLSLWSIDDANRDRGTEGFLVESSQANLLGQESRDDTLNVGEDPEMRNRSESTLGTLRSPMIDTQPQARPPPQMTKRPICETPAPTDPTMRISADRLYDFVVVGARGVGALARPWPVATVGTPTNLDFDISKAQFELNIKVTAADRPWGGKSPIRAEDGEEDEELATEIYIPIVHYAADSAFEGESAQACDGTPKAQSGSLVDEPTKFKDDDENTIVVHARSDSKASNESGEPVKRRRATTTTLRRGRANTTGTLVPILPPTDTASPTLALSGPIPLAAQSIMGTLVESEMLALEVEVSDGKWELDGQILRWWYDVPGEGEPDRELVIKVRRRGGPIKGVMRGFSVGSDAASVQSTVLWDSLCPPGGCVIV